MSDISDHDQQSKPNPDRPEPCNHGNGWAGNVFYPCTHPDCVARVQVEGEAPPTTNIPTRARDQKPYCTCPDSKFGHLIGCPNRPPASCERPVWKPTANGTAMWLFDPKLDAIKIEIEGESVYINRGDVAVWAEEFINAPG